jgi:hypothetical protein
LIRTLIISLTLLLALPALDSTTEKLSESGSATEVLQLKYLEAKIRVSASSRVSSSVRQIFLPVYFINAQATPLFPLPIPLFLKHRHLLI